MKIASIGGSNSIIKGSYNHILKEVENISINNKGIGGTNSLHGMINIIKYELIENYDYLYFYLKENCLILPYYLKILLSLLLLQDHGHLNIQDIYLRNI